MDVTKDWYWEGNVVDALANYLTKQGWVITAKANTHLKERGVDLQAQREGSTLLVEAKGYPSKFYRDPLKAMAVKPTNPINQAQQWYSHALLKVMRLQTSYPDAVVALAFPDFPRYRTLFDETRGGLEKLGIAFILIAEDGQAHIWGFQ